MQSRKPSSLAEIVSYSGADREQIFYAGAKAEGKLVWYTSLAGDSYKDIIRAFETKYPAYSVETYRAAGIELVMRLEEEYKANATLPTPSRPRRVLLCLCAMEECCIPTPHRC